EYQGPKVGSITLAILQQRVANHGDGWRHALEALERFFDRASGQRPPAAVESSHDEQQSRPMANGAFPAVQELIGVYLKEAATLGRRTAELHRALAQNQEDQAFAPEPLTAADLSTLATDACDQSRTALNLLQENLEQLPDAFHLQPCRVLNEAAHLLEALGRLSTTSITNAKIRCHGDFHLGQVLRVE